MTENNKSLGQKIREISSMTQGEFAKACGVDPEKARDHELGVSKPPKFNKNKIWEWLKFLFICLLIIQANIIMPFYEYMLYKHGFTFSFWLWGAIYLIVTICLLANIFKWFKFWNDAEWEDD
jgi:hypothetical protein